MLPSLLSQHSQTLPYLALVSIGHHTSILHVCTHEKLLIERSSVYGLIILICRGWYHVLALPTRYERRLGRVSSTDKFARSQKATFAAEHMVGALKVLERGGFRPVLRSGALIGAMRHGGWIDFGGSSYQVGSLYPSSVPCLFCLECCALSA